jgi:hypothetical protein
MAKSAFRGWPAFAKGYGAAGKAAPTGPGKIGAPCLPRRSLAGIMTLFTKPSMRMPFCEFI